MNKNPENMFRNKERGTRTTVPVDPKKLEEAETKVKEIEAKGGSSTTNDPKIAAKGDLDESSVKRLQELEKQAPGKKLG